MKKKLLILLILVMPMFIKASSAYIAVSSGTNTVVVGNNFNVTVKVSSSVALGSWEWTIDYDKSKFKLISGQTSVADYGDGSKKQASYTYTFKALSSGSGSISVKSYGAIAWDESSLSTTAGSHSVKVITQSELEASYSKNNNASNISVEGYELSPTFNKDTLEYKVDVPSNITSVNINVSKEDSTASVSGDGTYEVSEGDNKFEIVVTAQNGSTKTYIVTVCVSDPNPIIVKINDKEYSVVKRKSSLEAPNNYEEKTITINDVEVPALYSEINKYTLVGLKDEDGNISLYIYDDNEYIKYSEIELDKIKLLPLEMDMTLDGYAKTSIKVNDSEFEALKLINGTFSVIHGRNLETGKDDYYIYDSINNTVVKYSKDMLDIYINKIDKYQKVIILLLIETSLLFILLIISVIKKSKIKNKYKNLFKEIKKHDDKKDEIINTKEEHNNKRKKNYEKEKNN